MIILILGWFIYVYQRVLTHDAVIFLHFSHVHAIFIRCVRSKYFISHMSENNNIFEFHIFKMEFCFYSNVNNRNCLLSGKRCKILKRRISSRSHNIFYFLHSHFVTIITLIHWIWSQSTFFFFWMFIHRTLISGRFSCDEIVFPSCYHLSLLLCSCDRSGLRPLLHPCTLWTENTVSNFMQIVL